MTIACGAAIFLRASTAFSARYSWMKPMIAFNKMITPIAIASMCSPTRRLTPMATSRIAIIIFANCSKRI